ncbi:hypothetical protein HII31_03635 [Pseudocercospora fuligena]|uniref:BTB domain-containing protein n=1 Tax=Pseudocercospora fuligena TaxID=685502 RepID=A0A8H6RRM3_9PEZI|nr:hypothetical protein HII31_03635 [Pseudocercospora fuligena]
MAYNQYAATPPPGTTGRTRVQVAYPSNLIPENFGKNLRELAKDEASSDFTIVCKGNGREYKVHKLVVNLSSSYFTPVFNKQFREGQTGHIDLKDDWDEAIEIMVHYFYNLHYTLPDWADTAENDRGIGRLKAHAFVWATADKYQVPSLKFRAAEYFEDVATNARNMYVLNPQLQQATQPGHQTISAYVVSQPHIFDLLDAIDFIYEHSFRDLQQSVVKVWNSLHPHVKQAIPNESMLELIQKYPQLGVDLATTSTKYGPMFT